VDNSFSATLTKMGANNRLISFFFLLDKEGKPMGMKQYVKNGVLTERRKKRRKKDGYK
jgi:hypothetical protein